MSITIADNVKAGYYDSDTGTVRTGQRMGLNWNTAPVEYWCALNAFGDMMQRVPNAAIDRAPAVIDANGWYDCRGNGRVKWWLWSGENYPSYGTGKIVVTWTDFLGTANCTLTDYSGLTHLPGESSANRNVYAINGTGSSGMRCTQTDGYAIDVKVFMESDEPGVLAGRTASDQYISDLSNASWIRYMDFMYTNNSEVVDYADYERTGRGNYQYMKLTDIAAISNDTGIPPWICFPAMGTDACFTEMCQILKDNLNPGTPIRAELGNEIWNTGFKNNFEWYNKGDAPLIASDSFDGTTGIITKVAHGLDTMDAVNMMSFKGNWDWKYGKGADGRAIKIDDDNFKLAHDSNSYTTISGITNATTAVVTQAGHPHVLDQVIHLYRMGTGMVELEDVECTVKNVQTDTYDLWDKDGIAPIDSTLFGTFTQGRVVYDLYDSNAPGYQSSRKTNSSQTEVRYKRTKDASVIWNPYWYGRRCAELWAIADGIFGRDKVVAVLCEQTQIDGDMRAALNANGGAARSRFDLIATAPYFNLSNSSTGDPPAPPIPGGWENAPIEDITDYVIDNDFPYDGRSGRLDGVNRMIDTAAKCYRMCTYEGGDHTTTSSGSAKMEKHWEWTSSVVNGPSGIPAMQRCYEEYFKRLRELGLTDHSIFTMAHRTNRPNDSTPWGTQKVTGDVTTPKYLAALKYLTAGGVP